MPVDPLNEAVRRDLADVRLAGRVFAPHYAAPLPCSVTRAVSLRLAGAADSEVLARLEPGEVFEALEFAGANAWGIASGHGRVGYVALDALDREVTP